MTCLLPAVRTVLTCESGIGTASAANLDRGFEGGAIPDRWAVIDNDRDGYQWVAADESHNTHGGDYITKVHYNVTNNYDGICLYSSRHRLIQVTRIDNIYISLVCYTSDIHTPNRRNI